MDNILFLGNEINLCGENNYSISSIYNKIKKGSDPSDYDLKGVSFSVLFESLMNIKGYSYFHDKIKNEIYFFDIFDQGKRLTDPDLYKTLLQRYKVEYVPLIKTLNNEWINLYIEVFDNILNNDDAIN